MKHIYFLSIMLILQLGILNAQSKIVTGKISDVKGAPLAGVTVTAKDYPSLTTLSGADGEYRIEIYDFTKALVFSLSNFKTQEVLVKDTNVINVTMKYMALKNMNPWGALLSTYSAQTNVYNKAIDDNSQWQYSADPGFLLSAEIEYFFTQNFGLSTGIGFNLFNSSNKISDFNNYGENNIERTDSDGDIYYLYNEVKDVTEKWKIRTLSFPIKFKFRYRAKKVDFFGNVGFKYMLTTSAKIEVSGNSIWQAYYPDYHVVIYDVPPYDYTNYDVNSDNTLVDYAKNTSAMIIEAGVSKNFKGNYNIEVGIFYEKGFNDLKYNQPVHPGDFLNTVGIIDETKLSAVGIVIGFRYHFIKKR